MRLFKKYNEQVQVMGRGNTRELSNSNSPKQKNKNYNSVNNSGNLNRNQPIYQMNQNNRINMNNKNGSLNNYMKINNQNKFRQYQEESKKYNNNHLINNAKMILSNSNDVSKEYYKNNNNSNNYNKKNSILNNKLRNKSAIRYDQRNNSNLNNISQKLNNSEIIDNNYNYMEFRPYTLKDYKELIRNKVIMGPLGPNIGTEEWESKRNKMKKMLNYSNFINKEHTGIKSLKKYSPTDEVEMLTKQKIENSIRYRTNEYGKLVRAGSFKNKDNNVFNTDKNLDIIPESDDDYYLKKYEDQLRKEKEKENLNDKPKYKEAIEPVIEENNEDQLNLDELLKQKESYKLKILGLRESLLQ